MPYNGLVDAMTRSDWLLLAGPTALLAQDNPAHPDGPQRRIAQIIHAYEEQGIHRTAPSLAPTREIFTITPIDPITASLSANGRHIEGVPLLTAASQMPPALTVV